MDRSDGGWTVVNEIDVNGSCHPSEEPDGERTSPANEHKQRNQSKANLNATLNSGRTSETSDGKNHPAFHHYFVPTQRSDLFRASHGSFDYAPPSASPANQLDPKLCIPRGVENLITPLEMSKQFPHWREGEIRKWVSTCGHYRDEAYSDGRFGNPAAFTQKDFEREYPFQTRQVLHNQQHTPDVEHRQNKDIRDDLDNTEDNSESE